jgi:N-acetylneuraminic acid mutarotase
MVSIAFYNFQADFWTPMSSMPEAVNNAAAATDGYYLYIFGGRKGDELVSTGYNYTQVYDPISETWETSLDGDYPALPEPRGGAGKAVFFQGQFFVIGGETDDDTDGRSKRVYDRVDVFDPRTRTWSLGPSLNVARQGSFPVVAGNRIFVAGGGLEPVLAPTNSLEVYTP